jgi:hypothetical protein
MQRPNIIVCFFLIYAKIVIIKIKKSNVFLYDISYIIFKRQDNAN